MFLFRSSFSPARQSELGDFAQICMGLYKYGLNPVCRRRRLLLPCDVVGGDLHNLVMQLKALDGRSCLPQQNSPISGGTFTPLLQLLKGKKTNLFSNHYFCLSPPSVRIRKPFNKFFRKGGRPGGGKVIRRFFLNWR